MHQKSFYVYILTNDLLQRITEHYQNRGQQETFCGKYNVYYLLYFENAKYVNDAIAREKEIKGWRREKKLQLIATSNPELRFLNEEFFERWPPVNCRRGCKKLLLLANCFKAQFTDPSCVGMTGDPRYGGK